jgi:LytS/YehU family sensor histidine kinase
MMLFVFLLIDYRVSSKYVFSLLGVGALVYALICARVAISQRGWSSLILLLAWSVIAVNFGVGQLSQSYIEPNTIQSLLFPLVLALFLIRLIQNQISLSETQVKLSNALQAESEARLAALRSQLDPHFLFNLLTSIQVLSKFDPSKVPELVERLAAFLRFRLSSKETPYRSLIDEVTATQAYLDIEKVRFGDQLKAEFDIQPETQDWQVPEMILQPLVENAIKHGFAVDKPVRLLIKASLLASRLQLQVSNECHNTSNPEAEGGFGIGLSNTRDRLACLYGDRASLLVTESQNTFTANLQIPKIEQKTPPSDR